MQMLDDTIRMKLWFKKPEDSATLYTVDGKELNRDVKERRLDEDDIYFQVLAVGPLVEDIKVGNVICASIMSVDMVKLQHPDEQDKSFITRRPSVLGILYKQPPTK